MVLEETHFLSRVNAHHSQGHSLCDPGLCSQGWTLLPDFARSLSGPSTFHAGWSFLSVKGLSSSRLNAPTEAVLLSGHPQCLAHSRPSGIFVKLRMIPSSFSDWPQIVLLSRHLPTPRSLCFQFQPVSLLCVRLERLSGGFPPFPRQRCLWEPDPSFCLQNWIPALPASFRKLPRILCETWVLSL